MRLIDADALMDRYGEPCHSFADVIEDMPTIDAVHVEHNNDSAFLHVKNLDDWNSRIILLEEGTHNCAVYYQDDDAVPVVRCKDCKHRNTDKCPMRLNELAYCDQGIRGYSVYMQTKDHTIDDGFCYCGERKGEDECSTSSTVRMVAGQSSRDSKMRHRLISGRKST